MFCGILRMRVASPFIASPVRTGREGPIGLGNLRGSHSRRAPSGSNAQGLRFRSAFTAIDCTLEGCPILISRIIRITFNALKWG